MDTSQWPQGIGSVVVRAVENTRPTTTTTEHNTNKRPNKEQQQANNLNCPRCNSNNTKFCYYNNYSLSQPRYLCKACKRYWTEGGNLRSVPVGGGSRRNKRPSSPSSSSINISSSKKLVVPNNNLMAPPSPQNPKTIHDNNIGRQTLNLDFNPSASNYGMLPEFGAFPFGLTLKNPQNPSFCSSSGFSGFSNYNLACSSLVTTMPPAVPNNQSNSFFNMGFENNVQAASSSRVVFPFEESKPVSSTSDHEQGKRQQQQGDSNGDWINGSW